MRTLMQTADMEISGLGSGFASRGVRSALSCIHGVAQVSMVPNESHVSVIYDAFRVCPHQFETAVSVMGCEVERMVVSPPAAPAEDKVAEAPASMTPNNRRPRHRRPDNRRNFTARKAARVIIPIGG